GMRPRRRPLCRLRRHRRAGRRGGAAANRRRGRARAERRSLARARGPGSARGSGGDVTAIVVMEGDQTGQELLEEARRGLQPPVVGVELDSLRFDLSLEARRRTTNAVVHEAAAAVSANGRGLKAATVTPEGRDDVGSPNRILREGIDGRVIVRTG